MKVVIKNTVVDLDNIYAIDKIDRLTNGHCRLRIQELVLYVLNGNRIEFKNSSAATDEDWNSFCDNIIEFWAENKKENIKTFNV